MESLLKSEVISDDVRRLLLEIMFAGVNHSLISQVHAMLPALTVIVPDKKLQLVCLALLLGTGLNEPTKSRRKILSDIVFARGYGAASVISCTK